MEKSPRYGQSPISRRAIIVGGLVAGSASLLPAADADAKIHVPQSAVMFRTSSNNGHNCGSCKLFLEPSACRFVEGPITSDCSCWIWLGKAG